MAIIYKGGYKMAYIEARTNKRGQTKYRALVRVKGRPIQSRTFYHKTAAQEWANRIEIEMKDGKYFMTPEAQRRTDNDLIDRYNTDKKNPRVIPYLNIWRKFIGPYSLPTINRDILTDALHKIEAIPTPHGDKKTPATMNRYIAAMSVVFSYAYKKLDWIERNPFEKVDKYKEPKGIVRYLQYDQIDRLLTACKQSKNTLLYPAVLMALTTGARKNEILSLRWSDIDLQNRRAILQQTKNGERRSIPLAEPVLLVLQEMEQNRGTNEYVFPPTRESPIKHHANITHAWYNALKKAGIKEFRFHDLRHTAASYLMMNNTPTVAVANLLGHKTLDMTKRYSHLSDECNQEIVGGLTEKLFAQTQEQGGQ